MALDPANYWSRRMEQRMKTFADIVVRKTTMHEETKRNDPNWLAACYIVDDGPEFMYLPDNPFERINKIEAGLMGPGDDDLKLLYMNDPLVHALMDIGAQLAEKFHHCKSCDGHSCDIV